MNHLRDFNRLWHWDILQRRLRHEDEPIVLDHYAERCGMNRAVFHVHKHNAIKRARERLSPRRIKEPED